MTVHPLSAEPDTHPVSRRVFDTGHQVTGRPRLTSIRRNWVHADATHESDATDRRAA